MTDLLPPEEVTPEVLCRNYGSQLDNGEFPADLVGTIVEPTVLREGREAFFVFHYGEKKFKVTFEHLARVRKIK